MKLWHEFEHMVFDIDGTILNSNIAHVWSWQDAVESTHGFFPYFTMFMQMGLPGKQIVEKFNLPKEVSEKAKEFYLERYVELVAPFDNAHKLLKTLKTRDKKIHAITSASKSEAESMFKKFKLEPFFDEVITAEKSGEGKPTPDPFIRLREIIGPKADLISFGDSPFDLKASTAAGIPFVYLGHGGYPREWFIRAYASYFNITQLMGSIPKRARERTIHAA